MAKISNDCLGWTDQDEAVPDILSGIKNKLNPYCWIKLESRTKPAHKLLLEQTYQFKKTSSSILTWRQNFIKSWLNVLKKPKSVKTCVCGTYPATANNKFTVNTKYLRHQDTLFSAI